MRRSATTYRVTEKSPPGGANTRVYQRAPHGIQHRGRPGRALVKTEEGRWQEASLSCSLEYNNEILLRVACRVAEFKQAEQRSHCTVLGLTVTPGAANQS